MKTKEKPWKELKSEEAEQQQSRPGAYVLSGVTCSVTPAPQALSPPRPSPPRSVIWAVFGARPASPQT